MPTQEKQRAKIINIKRKRKRSNLLQRKSRPVSLNSLMRNQELELGISLRRQYLARVFRALFTGTGSSVGSAFVSRGQCCGFDPQSRPSAMLEDGKHFSHTPFSLRDVEPWAPYVEILAHGNEIARSPIATLKLEEPNINQPLFVCRTTNSLTRHVASFLRPSLHFAVFQYASETSTLHSKK